MARLHLATPKYCYIGLVFSAFARRYWRNAFLFIFLVVLKCFTSHGMLCRLNRSVVRVRLTGFPHSEIFGSKVARHLPESYRRHAASFIASKKPRHPPYALIIPVRNSKNRILIFLPTLLHLYTLDPRIYRLRCYFSYSENNNYFFDI